MTSRERFLTALRGGKPDRTPLAHVSALTTVELQTATGCYMPGAHYDPEQLVKLLFANHQVLKFDAVTFLINYFNEPAALGCRIDWGDSTTLPVYLSHPWAGRDPEIPDDLLDRAPLNTCLKALRLAQRKHGKDVAVLGKIMGPFSLVQVMCGVERTMLSTIVEPDRLAHLLDAATDILLRFGNAQFAAGADALAIGEGGAGSNMLSPAMHERFLLKPHQRLNKGLGGPTIMHICGDITPRLQLLADTGLTCFNFDWAISPKVMKEAAGRKFRLMGNVNTADLLRADPAEIDKQVRENLLAGTDIISPGCAISPKCPNANLLAMSAAISKYQNHT